MKANEGKSRRPQRVAADIRHAIARMIGRDLSDPRLEGVVVSSVVITNDLRIASIGWRLVSGDAEARKGAQKGLERVSARLRRAIGQELGLRHAPELRFAYDEGQDARDRIDQLLEEVKRERKG